MERAVAWQLETDVDHGIEVAFVRLGGERLQARGTAIRTTPEPYVVEYTLRTTSGYVTRRLRVTARGTSWRRALDLRRERDGRWTCATSSDGSLDADPPGCRADDLASALDCDLGLSPLTNTMPVLRHDLLTGGDAVEFAMAWVSVPDLHVSASAQRYAFARREDDRSVVRFSSSGYSSDITFDSDGLVVDYPGLARRVGG